MKLSLLCAFQLLAWRVDATKMGEAGSDSSRMHAATMHRTLLNAFWGETEPLDAASLQLIADAPPQAHVNTFLNESITALPEEVRRVVKKQGAEIVASKRISMVTDSTWLLDLDPPLVQGGKQYARAVVSILGSQMSDYPFGFWTSTVLVKKAHDLAQAVGIPVPDILATGEIQTEIGSLGFLVHQFVQSDTSLPNAEPADDADTRISLSAQIDNQTGHYDLASFDTAPLPRFDTELDVFKYLQTFTPAEFSGLHQALNRIVGKLSEEATKRKQPASPHKLYLKHPSLAGNLLMSKNPKTQQWSVDAVVDWDSATIRGSHLFAPTKKNAATLAVMFSQVAKGAYLAHCYVNHCMPICNLQKHVELYNEHAQKIVRTHALPSFEFETWATLVDVARKHMEK